MSYRLDVDPVAQAQIRALPSDALGALAEVMSMFELTPWDGPSINEDNPEGNVRVLPFGSGGMVTYLILEDQRRVDVLDVLWVG
ncbi:MAG TPA: hypothetical protein VL595_30290 [Pseudonocardia sp.]|nr:hypothetical protein [Pseudonocardia sp.]